MMERDNTRMVWFSAGELYLQLLLLLKLSKTHYSHSHYYCHLPISALGKPQNAGGRQVAVDEGLCAVQPSQMTLVVSFCQRASLVSQCHQGNCGCHFHPWKQWDWELLPAR